jgi:hypothetical protein
MKHITSLVAFLIVLLSSIATFAQPRPNPTITFSSSNPATNEVVTMTVDVTGTALANQELYLWAFLKTVGGDSPNNGPSFNAPNPPAIFINAGNNIYTKTFKVDDYFARSAADFVANGNSFQYLIRNAAGNIQTDDKSQSVSPPKFFPLDLGVFPANFTPSDIVTFFFDPAIARQSNAPDNLFADNISEMFLVLGATIDSATLESKQINTPISQAIAITTPSLKMKKVGNRFQLSIYIPSYFRGVANVRNYYAAVVDPSGRFTYPSTSLNSVQRADFKVFRPLKSAN